MATITWAFLRKEAEVEMLGERVAYSWTCGKEQDPNHDHIIDCLWVWHYCDLKLSPIEEHWTDIYVGWKPTGVVLHDLISTNPLHVEASVYWPRCCGMHGWIRDGKWIDA